MQTKKQDVQVQDSSSNVLKEISREGYSVKAHQGLNDFDTLTKHLLETNI